MPWTLSFDCMKTIKTACKIKNFITGLDLSHLTEWQKNPDEIKNYSYWPWPVIIDWMTSIKTVDTIIIVTVLDLSPLTEWQLSKQWTKLIIIVIGLVTAYKFCLALIIYKCSNSQKYANDIHT